MAKLDDLTTTQTLHGLNKFVSNVGTCDRRGGNQIKENQTNGWSQEQAQLEPHPEPEPESNLAEKLDKRLLIL